MASVSKDLGWLSRQTIEYRSYMDDAMGVVEDLDELGKHGRGFSSTDDLEKVDIGDGVIPRPTYVSAHLNTGQKQKIIELLKVYMRCFAWDYTVMWTSTPAIHPHLHIIRFLVRLLGLVRAN
jgi:hypothetical protein